MVLGKLPVPGRPTNMNNSRARAYWDRGYSDIFSLIIIFLLFLPLWEIA